MRILGWFVFPIYWFVAELRNLFYDFKIFPVKKVKIPVICIGNVSMGGTGKTPWVSYVVHRLKTLGKNPVIISRGYKGNYQGVLRVTENTLASECGDEPLMLYHKTGCPTYVSKSRYQGAVQALKDDKFDVIVLDDGFQHRALHRDLDITLMDATVGLKKAYYREPLYRLNRAQLCVLNKANFVEKSQLESLHSTISSYYPEDQIIRSEYQVSEVEPLFTNVHGEINKDKVCVACAIANPSSFLKTVKGQGISPLQFFRYGDHYSWTKENVLEILQTMKKLESRDLLITEKDSVKMKAFEREFSEAGVRLWIVKIGVVIPEAEKKVDEILSSLF